MIEFSSVLLSDRLSLCAFIVVLSYINPGFLFSTIVRSMVECCQSPFFVDNHRWAKIYKRQIRWLSIVYRNIWSCFGGYFMNWPDKKKIVCSQFFFLVLYLHNKNIFLFHFFFIFIFKYKNYISIVLSNAHRIAG